MRTCIYSCTMYSLYTVCNYACKCMQYTYMYNCTFMQHIKEGGICRDFIAYSEVSSRIEKIDEYHKQSEINTCFAHDS